MNRGSRGCVARRRISARRFNEAPIHESGKSLFTPLFSHTVYSFNEAPIHESGKFGIRRARAA